MPLLIATEETMDSLKDTFDALEKHLRASSFIKDYPNFDLLIYGSTVNGLCVKGSSDLDLTLIINDFVVDHGEILEKIKNVLL